MTSTMLYFAYGSNLSSLRLAVRTPSARFVALASLPAHQLRFHKIGMDGSAKCDAFATRCPSDRVVGVVYRLDPADKPALDRAEGVGRGYREKQVVVETASGQRLSALTYCATRIDPDLRPFAWYQEHVLRGAREWRLPEHYRQVIEAVETQPDPDLERHRRELAIYPIQ